MRPNDAFDQRATKTFRSFWGATWVKFSKFWPGDTSVLDANGSENFPLGFFTHFGRPTAENYESVFLTVVQPNGAFDRGAAKTWARSFWPSCDYFPITVLLNNGATNGGLAIKMRSFLENRILHIYRFTEQHGSLLINSKLRLYCVTFYTFPASRLQRCQSPQRVFFLRQIFVWSCIFCETLCRQLAPHQEAISAAGRQLHKMKLVSWWEASPMFSLLFPLNRLQIW